MVDVSSCFSLTTSEVKFIFKYLLNIQISFKNHLCIYSDQFIMGHFVFFH